MRTSLFGDLERKETHMKYLDDGTQVPESVEERLEVSRGNFAKLMESIRDTLDEDYFTPNEKARIRSAVDDLEAMQR